VQVLRFDEARRLTHACASQSHLHLSAESQRVLEDRLLFPALRRVETEGSRLDRRAIERHREWATDASAQEEADKRMKKRKAWTKKQGTDSSIVGDAQ
jgi:hypothetical protein